MEFLEGNEWGYDPAYVGEDEEDSKESNQPVGIDDWAQDDYSDQP